MIFESITKGLNFILDPILSPLLNFPPFWAILIISFIATLIITLIYKAVTDQTLMKRLKKEMKEFQKEMKELKDKPNEMMKVQKKAMETNMKYMMQSFKPTLFTFIPIILIISWASAHLAYHPIEPNEDFTVTVETKDNIGKEMELTAPQEVEIISNPTQEISSKSTTWTLNGQEGEFLLEFEFNDTKYNKKVIITEEAGNYAQVEKRVNDNLVKKIELGNEKVKPIGNISIFGWYPGWLATYIVLSIIFSIALRKALKIA